MSYTKDNIEILIKRIRALSSEQFIEEFKDAEVNQLPEVNNIDTRTKVEQQEILIASSTDVQLLALARQKFLDWGFIPDEEEAKNEIKNLWNLRWNLAQRLGIPINVTELLKGELNMLSKKMIEWFQTREELKENPEGVKNYFSEGNIYKA